MSRISDAFHTLVREVKQIGVDLYTAFFQAAQQSVRDAGPALLESATNAVLAAEASPGDGKVKLAAATASVLKDLESKGVPVALNAVNLAVEAAVANMKSSQAPGKTVASIAPAGALGATG